MAQKINARIASVTILRQLLKQQGSWAGEAAILTGLDEREQRFAKELCYGICRWYFLIDQLLQPFITKPLKTKDEDIQLLLVVGVYQLLFTRVAPHAAINETVNAALFFHKPWAKKFINGVLRAFQRQQASGKGSCPNPDADDYAHHCRQSHPHWLQQQIIHHWPQQANAIFTANNQHPPFTLRVNQQHAATTDYISLLNAKTDSPKGHPTPYSLSGATLDKAIDVKQLPGFSAGHISVQDEAAQLAAPLLQLQPQLRVLDACCAPGGKTCHIGELQPDLATLVALDVNEHRLDRVRDNLTRLNVRAEVIAGDAGDPTSWWNGEGFDRILLDAPCSATGVIRRHPDIKLLQTQHAVDSLVELQLSLLMTLWPLLQEGGILLYATCSLLPQENTHVIERFIAKQAQAEHDTIHASWGIPQPYGRQLLPQQNGHDGFYYARIIKRKAHN